MYIVNFDEIDNTLYLRELEALEEAEHEHTEQSLDRYLFRIELYRKMQGAPYGNLL